MCGTWSKCGCRGESCESGRTRITSGDGLSVVASPSRVSTISRWRGNALSHRRVEVKLRPADARSADNEGLLLPLVKMPIQNEPIGATVPHRAPTVGGAVDA